jgi:methyl-accepting chemotaxis protein
MVRIKLTLTIYREFMTLFNFNDGDAADSSDSSKLFRDFALPQIGICFLAIGMAVALLFIMLNQQNSMALKQDADLIEYGISSRTNAVKSTLSTNTQWSDAVENLVLNMNSEWADVNIGPFIYESTGIDYSFVIDGDGETLYSSYQKERMELSANRVMSDALKNALNRLKRIKSSDRQMVSGITRFGKKTAVYSISPIKGDKGDADTLTKADAVAPRYMMFVDVIDNAAVAEIAKDFSIKNLRISTMLDGDFVVLDYSGKEISSLTWTPSKPGTAIFWSTLPWLIMASILIAGCCVYVFRRAQNTTLYAIEASRDLAWASESARMELEKTVTAVQAENKQLMKKDDQNRIQAAMLAQEQRNKAADRFESGAAEALARLHEAATGLTGASVQLKGASASSLSEVANAGRAIDATTSDVVEIAPAANQLSALAHKSANQANEALALISALLEESSRGAELMIGLSSAYSRIDEFTGLINEIATQTNLLALNATIEAARAGEAGKGFAVVAGEVKSLASRSAELSALVAQEAGHLHQQTDHAITAVTKITDGLSNVAKTAQDISQSVTHQDQAVQQIEHTIVTVSKESQKITHAMSSIRRASDDTDSASGNVANLAQMVQSRSDELEAELNAFLQFLRNAA